MFVVLIKLLLESYENLYLHTKDTIFLIFTLNCNTVIRYFARFKDSRSTGIGPQHFLNSKWRIPETTNDIEPTVG